MPFGNIPMIQCSLSLAHRIGHTTLTLWLLLTNCWTHQTKWFTTSTPTKDLFKPRKHTKMLRALKRWSRRFITTLTNQLFWQNLVNFAVLLTVHATTIQVLGMESRWAMLKLSSRSLTLTVCHGRPGAGDLKPLLTKVTNAKISMETEMERALLLQLTGKALIG